MLHLLVFYSGNRKLLKNHCFGQKSRLSQFMVRFVDGEDYELNCDGIVVFRQTKFTFFMIKWRKKMNEYKYNQTFWMLFKVVILCSIVFDGWEAGAHKWIKKYFNYLCENSWKSSSMTIVQKHIHIFHLFLCRSVIFRCIYAKTELDGQLPLNLAWWSVK